MKILVSKIVSAFNRRPFLMLILCLIGIAGILIPRAPQENFIKGFCLAFGWGFFLLLTFALDIDALYFGPKYISAIGLFLALLSLPANFLLEPTFFAGILASVSALLVCVFASKFL